MIRLIGAECRLGARNLPVDGLVSGFAEIPGGMRAITARLIRLVA